MRRKFRDILRFTVGFILERPTIDIPLDFAAEGSSNCLFTGQGEPEPFKGFSLIADAVGGTHYSGGKFGLIGQVIAPVSGALLLEDGGALLQETGGQILY